LKECTKRLTVEYEILACDRLPVSEDGFTYSNLTLPTDQFNNRPSFIVGHNKSRLVLKTRPRQFLASFHPYRTPQVAYCDPIITSGQDFAMVKSIPSKSLWNRSSTRWARSNSALPSQHRECARTLQQYRRLFVRRLFLLFAGDREHRGELVQLGRPRLLPGRDFHLFWRRFPQGLEIVHLIGLRYPMLMHQTDTIIWIPISEKLPPSGLVLASTKDSVHVLQYHKGQEQITHSDFWMDRLGKKSDIQFEDVLAWTELPRPFWHGGQ
jgi:hypothetical protein